MGIDLAGQPHVAEHFILLPGKPFAYLSPGFRPNTFEVNHVTPEVGVKPCGRLQLFTYSHLLRRATNSILGRPFGRAK